jgi:peptidoglycan/xylan/chitin deacetylase (PgdA/CDA1 family)
VVPFGRPEAATGVEYRDLIAQRSAGMLRRAKLLFLEAASALRLPRLVLSSRWRRSRLLILCYHGVAVDDEHRWSPELYVSEERLRARLARLQSLNCSVVSLGEGIERLHSGTLPERAVALTFDDGFFDFSRLAWPLIRSYSWPVTVYLSTYYTEKHYWPVFDPMTRYLLWKAAGRRLDWPAVLADPLELDEIGRAAADAAIKAYCRARKLSGADKNEILNELARRLGVDLGTLSAKRILHLMNEAEVRQVASEGVDVQLHTHRHRVFRSRERFWKEVDDNRERILALTGRNPVHFCYPSGCHLSEFPAWLRERGVLTATTCDPGIADADTDRLLLPRFLDSESVSELEFDAWVTGVAQFMPRRRYPAGTYSLQDEGDGMTPTPAGTR